MIFKRITASVLVGAMLLGMTACNGTGGTSEESSKTALITTEDDNVVNPVDVSDIELSGVTDIDDIEPAELTYLGCYDITTAGDVKPAYKYFQENYGCSITCTIVGSLQIQEKLQTSIASDTSPDLVDYADNTFPLLMSKNMYTPLNEYMDLSKPQWAGLEDYINKYKWNGKNYYYPWSYNVSPMYLIYNRGLFEQLGIDDPKELYDRGEWDWDAFKKCMVDFVNTGENRTGLYGYLSTALFDSTGVPLVSINENGTLSANFVDPNIERAANFLQELKTEGISKYPEGGYINVDMDPILNGLTAFQGMGGWIIANYAKKQSKDDSYDIFFVPFPKDPNADEYYIGMSTFGYLVPANSKYAKQASVFINCVRLSKTDTELAEITKESEMRSKKYTEEMYDFMMSFVDPEEFNCVVDEPYGLDESTQVLIQDMIQIVSFTPDNAEDDKTWTQMREANNSAIQKQIDYYNDLIASSNNKD